MRRAQREAPALFVREPRLLSLPAPDALDCTLPEGHVCLVTDDGAGVSVSLAEALAARGWPVALLRSPFLATPSVAAREALPEAVAAISLRADSEEHLSAALAQVRREHGPVGAFIHVNPPHPHAAMFDEREMRALKWLFLAAKHLQPDLASAASVGEGTRACFVTVARLDGAWGLRDGIEAGGPVSGGLAGLTKTLAQEWPAVHCRAVDLALGLDAAAARAAILAELHDPNRRIVEVGWGERGRVTLVASVMGG